MTKNKQHIYHIEALDDERVSAYTRLNEPQLFHYNEPDTGLFIAETTMVIERALDRGLKPVSFFVEEGLTDRDDVRRVIDKVGEGVDLYVAEHSVIRNITGYNLTGGVLSAFRRPEMPDVKDLLTSGRRIAVLENIVNPTNMGAIIRSAAAMGVDSILITPNSTDPFYRRAARVSMGTVFQVPWTYIPKDTDWIDLLHEYGFTVISMELAENAVPLNDPVLRQSEKRAVVFGAEGPGVSETTLVKSDYIAVIPMRNGVSSLNVAASSAVAFWVLC